MEYSSFNSIRIKEEISRLEAMLADRDTALSDSNGTADSAGTEGTEPLTGLEIMERLFELSTHRANTEFDLDKIFEYASFLYKNGGPDSLRYLNWGRAVKAQQALVAERDSLNAAINTGDKEGSESIEMLKKEKRFYLKQIDSLNTVITTQQETVEKLQKLDVLMEQQRSKIQ